MTGWCPAFADACIGGYDTAKSRQTPFPFTRNLNAAYIVKHAKKLWDEVCVLLKSGHKFNNVGRLSDTHSTKPAVS